MALTRMGQFDAKNLMQDSALKQLHERRTERQNAQSSATSADASMLSAQASMSRAQEGQRAGEATRATALNEKQIIAGAPKSNIGPNSTPGDLVKTFREQYNYYNNAGMRDEADRILTGLNDLQKRIQTKAHQDAGNAPKAPPTALEDADTRDTSRQRWDENYSMLQGAQMGVDDDGNTIAAIPINPLAEEIASKSFHEMAQKEGVTIDQLNQMVRSSMSVLESNDDEQVPIPNEFIERQRGRGMEDADIASFYVKKLQEQYPQLAGRYVSAEPRDKRPPTRRERSMSQRSKLKREKAVEKYEGGEKMTIKELKWLRDHGEFDTSTKQEVINQIATQEREAKTSTRRTRRGR